MNQQLQQRWLLTAGLYTASITTALVLSAFLVWVTNGSWREVFSALLDGSIRQPGRWGLTIGVATPLLLVALGTVISVRAGLINIGQEGQVLIGAAVCAYVGTRMDGPGVLVLAVALLAGLIGGAIWAGVAGALKYWRRVPEVLTTLLLVTVAFQLVGYALKTTTLLLDRSPGRPNRNQTSAQLAENVRLDRVSLFGNEFPTSAIVAVGMALLLVWWLSHTISGFRLAQLGKNAKVAHRMGVSAPKAGMLAMLASGGFAGLAGAMMLTGGDQSFGSYRLTPGFSDSIGWEGLLVALVARNHPVLSIPTAFIFAMLRNGSSFLAATGVEREITQVVQALLVLGLLVPPTVLYLKDRSANSYA